MNCVYELHEALWSLCPVPGPRVWDRDGRPIKLTAIGIQCCLYSSLWKCR